MTRDWVHGMRGWVQGYNAQAVCNEQHVIVAADVMTASPDFGHLGPMITQAREELAAAGISEAPTVVLADAGYWHLEQMNEITADGSAVLIPPDSSRRKDAPPGWNGGAYAFMRSVLATEQGAELYKQRGQLIEPIFANTKHNRGFTRFFTPRKSRRTDRMAPDGHHPQPAEAAPPLQPARLTTDPPGLIRPAPRRPGATALRDSLTRRRHSARLRYCCLAETSVRFEADAGL